MLLAAGGAESGGVRRQRIGRRSEHVEAGAPEVGRGEHRGGGREQAVVDRDALGEAFDTMAAGVGELADKPT